MGTVGVRGVWGLEHLERTGASTLRCGVLAFAVLAPINYVLVGIHFGAAPTVLFCLLEVLYLTAAIFMSRTTQADLEYLSGQDEGIAASLERLQPPKSSIILWSSLALIHSWVGLAYGLTSLLDLGVAEFHRGFVMRGAGEFVFWYVAQPLYSLVLGVLAAVLFAQARALWDAAGRIEIDLFSLHRYPRLANGLVRILAFILVFSSVLLVFAVVTVDPSFEHLLRITIPFLAVSALFLIALFAYPVWIFQGRVRTAKAFELQLVHGALRGQKPAMKMSQLGESAQTLSIPELLEYRSFVDSLSEWPIAPHIRRIVLFGLIPPLTWVLASLIESAVSSVVGIN